MLRHLSTILLATVGLLPLGAFRLRRELAGTPASAGHRAAPASTVHVPVASPPATPTLALPSEQPYGLLRNPSLCAAECFEGVASYSTPPYVSLDQPRSVTLVYRSGQATPRGVVMVDATDPGPTPAAKMSIKIDRGDGTYVSSTSGADSIFYQTGLGINRLAFIISTRSVGMTSLNYKAVVTAYDAAGVPSVPAEIPVRIFVVNERPSPFGAGWSMVGFGRVYERSSTVLIITNGDGSAGYFQASSCPSTCTYTSPRGDFSTVTRRASWADGIKWDRRFPDGTALTYRSDGQIATARDRFGNQTTYEYNAAGVLQRVIDPAGFAFDFGYDANGKLSSIAGPGGRVSRFTVNAAGDLTQIVDPDGVVAAAFTYDSEHLLLTRTDRHGSRWGYGYDFADKLASDTMPEITADGGPVRPVRNFRSLETASLVDPRSGRGTPANPAPRVNPDTLRALVTSARGHTTKLALDRFGAPTRIEEPLGGRRTKIHRDFAGRPIRMVTPSEHTTWYTWSATLPNLNQVQDSVTGERVTYVYDSTRYNLVQRVTRTGATTSTTVNTLSADGKVVASSSVDGKPATTFEYDSRGRLITETDPEGHVVAYDYSSGAANPTGNLATVTSGTRVTTTRHDALGRVRAAVDPTGVVDSVEYDALNRATLSRRAGRTIVHEYAPLQTIVRTNGLAYLHAFNRLGWLDSLRHPDLRVERYVYDREGRVTATTNRRGQTVSFTYDELGNLTSRTSAEGETAAFHTDARDQFVTAANGESRDSVALDVLGRPVGITKTLNGRSYTLAPGYAGNTGPRTSLAASGPGWSVSLAYHYNAQQQLDSLRDVNGGWTTLTYDGEHLLSQVRLPSGFSVFTSFPGNHRPSDIGYEAFAVSGWLRQSYGYTRRAQVEFREHGPTWEQQFGYRGVEYQYDDLGQLAQTTTYVRPPESTCPDGSPAIVDEQDGTTLCNAPRQVVSTSFFGFDALGNPTAGSARIEAGTNRLVRSGGDTLLYDADGNLVRRYRLTNPSVFDQSLSWNSLGQLVQVSTTRSGVTTTVGFGYDAGGRRVRKTVNGVATFFLHDDNNLLAEFDAAGGVTAEYTFYPDAVDQPHSVRRGGRMYYYHMEVPGNVAGLTDAARNVAVVYQYDEFGTFTAAPNDSLPNPLRFGAREWDAETGLYYMRARYYDPGLGGSSLRIRSGSRAE